MYLRVLGAKVGARSAIATSSISMPTMVSVGHDASVGYGVALRPWRVEDGWVVVAPITIGANAFVGANAVLEPGATVSAGALLGELSVLSENECVPVDARWSGAPAKPTEKLDPTLETMTAAAPELRPWRWQHIAASTLGLIGLELSAIAMIVPGVALVWWALLGWGVLAGLVATLIAGPVFVLTVCIVVAVGKRLVLPRIPVGGSKVGRG
jgi:non-ribosomal peptide synthetase-like protein